MARGFVCTKKSWWDDGSSPSLTVLPQALQLPAAVIIAGKAALAFPMTYHTANGVRHLVCAMLWVLRWSSLPGIESLTVCCPLAHGRQVWDTGRNLDTVPDVYKSAYVTLATSSLLAVGIGLL
jgi:hypothetical protein